MSDLLTLGAGRGAYASAFSPTDIAGLKLWLKADAITGLSNNDPVGTWTDSSGQGNNATQATTSKKPVYKTGIQNGLPAVRFDGVDDSMSLSLNLGTTHTIFAVTHPASGVALLGNDSPLLILFFDAGGGSWWYYRSGFVSFAAGSLSDVNRILAYTRNGTSVKFFNNGSQVDTAKTLGANDSAVITTLGARDAGNYFWNKDVLEVLAYDSVLSSTDRQSVETYLNAKYALY